VLTAATELFQGRDRYYPLSPLPGIATQLLPAKNNQAPPPIDLIDTPAQRPFAELFWNQVVYGEVKNQFCTCMPEVNHLKEG